VRNRFYPGLVAFAGGLLFSVGLSLSGMTIPAKVIGFLDLAGDWDPTLAFVMAGGVSVFAIAWRAARRLRAPVLAPAFPPPFQEAIDRRLIAGAILFGVGWGLVGLCPGPALVAAGAGVASAAVFVAAMAAGMLLHHLVARSREL
jgi:uncharacterized protein